MTELIRADQLVIELDGWADTEQGGNARGPQRVSAVDGLPAGKLQPFDIFGIHRPAFNFVHPVLPANIVIDGGDHFAILTRALPVGHCLGYRQVDLLVQKGGRVLDGLQAIGELIGFVGATELWRHEQGRNQKNFMQTG